ncbi:MAG: L-lactate permease [Candidatus Promineifilaceae bacterium]|nr:L-lactate permease [Candidatus Promineifilaceae bacterium]
MNLPAVNLINVLAAAAPILLVLYLMIGRNWGGSKAGPAGWLAAILLAVVFYGANLDLLAVATGRSILLALFVLYIIWMALLLYHVVNDAGAIDVIGQQLPQLAGDRASQALLLGWVFGSFLQGASGFGVPAAVVAPLLVGLGFAANAAVVVALLGHAWAVTFGSLGSSFFSLIAATGQPGEVLEGPAALALALACFACGFGVLWATGRWAAVKQRWPQLILVGSVMATTQVVLALAGLWSLAAFGAGLIGLIIIILDLRYQVTEFVSSRQENVPASQATGLQFRPLFKAIVPYGLLTLIIVLGQLVFARPLNVLMLNPDFPAVETSYGWSTAAGPGRSISVLGHAGALLLYVSLLSYAWFRWQGTLNGRTVYSGRSVAAKTIRGSVKSTIGITSLVALAVTMQHAGMTQILAEVLSAGTGPVFPLLSPFIGALGAFMTGSNTNSNVVFGQLQQETALALQLSVPLILAGQTAGGAIGSLFAPAKVLVGCSTVKGAEDGQVLKAATLYGLAIVALIGLAVWIAALAG